MYVDHNSLPKSRDVFIKTLYIEGKKIDENPLWTVVKQVLPTCYVSDAQETFTKYMNFQKSLKFNKICR